MKKLYILTILLFISYMVNAQVPSWIWAKNGLQNDEARGYSIASDTSGNIYVTGDFWSVSITFDTITLNSKGDTDIFIVKYNSSGKVIWAKSAGGNGYDHSASIATDKNGNVYITGKFYSDTMNISGTVLINSNSNKNTGDIFIAKYNSNGNLVWEKSAGNKSYDLGKGITTDAKGNVYVTGSFYASSINFGGVTLTGSSASSYIFILKLDSNGNTIWAKSAGGDNANEGNAICVDINENVYITGDFKSTYLTFGNIILKNITGNPPAPFSFFITKYDRNGNVIWAKNSKGNVNTTRNGDHISNAIVTDAIGNVYATGYFASNYIQFDNDSLFNFIRGGPGSKYLFVVKYNSLGNEEWARTDDYTGTVDQEDGDIGYGICADGNNNIYVTGAFGWHLKFGNTATITNVNVNSKHDIFLMKYDNKGSALWSKSVGTSTEDAAYGVCLDAKNKVYITGTYNGAKIKFDTTSLINSGVYDVFVAKSDEGTTTVWPGDANHNYIVDNNDLLPIGLHYGQTGLARGSVSNNWQGYSATDWGTTQTNGQDIKHADCNGDGIINDNDTSAIDLNFNLTHAIIPNYNQERLIAPDLYFVTSSGTYNSGNFVDLEVWSGTSITPVNNLYGIAFNINYTASLVQSGTESLTYPTSWLGVPGTNAIKLGKIDALATTAYGAETRINHTNADGYGKIADFKFQLKNGIAPNTKMLFSISGYKANDSIGASVLFNTKVDSIIINPSVTGIKEITDVKVVISPNPFNQQTTISFNKEIKNATVKITDVLGKEVRTINFSGSQLIIEKGEMETGIYFLQVTTANELIANRKMVIQ